MMKQLKQVSILILCCLFFTATNAQSGLPKWVFPGTSSKVLDLSTGNLSNLPTPGGTYNYSGGSASFGYTNFTDDNGNLLFFIVDNIIYDGQGYFIERIDYVVDNFNANPSPTTSLTSVMNSDLRVINVPGDCNKYYIIFSADNTKQDITHGHFYVTLDMNLPNRYDNSRLGQVTSLHAASYNNYLPGWEFYNQHYARPIESYSRPRANDIFGGVSMVFTQPKNGQRFMYITGTQRDVKRFVVDANGFTDDNYSLEDYVISEFGQALDPYDLYPNGGNGKMNDADIVKLSNGNYKMVFSSFASGGWNDFGWSSVAVLVATIDGNSGDIINFESVKHPSLSGNERIVSGLEFSQNGDYLYISNYKFPYLHYVDLSAGSNSNGEFTPQAFQGATTNVFQDFKEGHIERGLNGELYFAKATGLAKLANSNNPNSTWNANAISLSLDQISYYYGDPGDRGYVIPQSLNNENYNHKQSLFNGFMYGPNQSSTSLCDGDIANFTLYNADDDIVVTWPDNSNGNSYSVVASNGSNRIDYTLTNSFGCSIDAFYSYLVGPQFRFQFDSNNYEYCPAAGSTQVSFQVTFRGGPSSNSLTDVVWTKDGIEVFGEGTDNVNQLTVYEPGEYCVKIKDAVSGCFSDLYCIDVVEGPCSVTDPDFNFTTNTNATGYTVTVTPNELDNCYGHAYYIEDIDNNPWQYYSWNQVQGTILNTNNNPYQFNYGTNYRIIHGIWSNCQSYTSKSYTINLSQGGSLRTKEEGESDIKLVNEIENEQVISFYPNPVSSSLKSNLLDEEYSRVELYNVQGQKVIEQTHNLNEIDVNTLTEGVYMVRVIKHDGSEKVSKRIVKQ